MFGVLDYLELHRSELAPMTPMRSGLVTASEARVMVGGACDVAAWGDLLAVIIIGLSVVLRASVLTARITQYPRHG
jgi:hypothetical protein